MKGGQAMTEKRYLTLPFVAEILGMSQKQFREWRRAGKLPQGRKIGRRIYYSVPTVEKMLGRKLTDMELMGVPLYIMKGKFICQSCGEKRTVRCICDECKDVYCVCCIHFVNFENGDVKIWCPKCFKRKEATKYKSTSNWEECGSNILWRWEDEEENTSGETVSGSADADSAQ